MLSLQPSAHSIVRVMNACPVPVPSFAESFRTPGHPSTFLLITAAVTLFSLLTLEPVTPSLIVFTCHTSVFPGTRVSLITQALSVSRGLT